jgi:hypothetical protein
MTSKFTFTANDKQMFEIPIIVKNKQGGKQFVLNNIHADTIVVTQPERETAIRKASNYVSPKDCSVDEIVGVLVKDENNQYTGLQFGVKK